MAAKKSAKPVAEKPARKARTKSTALFEVTFNGTTKIVEATSKAAIKKSVLSGFSIRKLGVSEAFQAGTAGATIEALGAELGI